MLPEILGRWYTQKRDITLKQFDAGAVWFFRNKTGEAVVHCSNTTCPILSYHLPCLKLMGVPKNWMRPLRNKGFTNSKAKKAIMSDDTTKEVVKLDTAICICSEKATTSYKLTECLNNPCMNDMHELQVQT